jgi:hypothetical protein
MSDPANESESAYHLYLEPDEVQVTASALRLLIADEAHQPEIRGLARSVLTRLEAGPAGSGRVSLAAPEPAETAAKARMATVPLSAPEMKITHTAVRLLINDLQREQHDERQILWRVIEKLPDEHVIRAIAIE